MELPTTVPQMSNRPTSFSTVRFGTCGVNSSTKIRLEAILDKMPQPTQDDLNNPVDYLNIIYKQMVIQIKSEFDELRYLDANPEEHKPGVTYTNASLCNAECSLTAEFLKAIFSKHEKRFVINHIEILELSSDDSFIKANDILFINCISFMCDYHYITAVIYPNKDFVDIYQSYGYHRPIYKKTISFSDFTWSLKFLHTPCKFDLPNYKQLCMAELLLYDNNIHREIEEEEKRKEEDEEEDEEEEDEGDYDDEPVEREGEALRELVSKSLKGKDLQVKLKANRLARLKGEDLKSQAKNLQSEAAEFLEEPEPYRYAEAAEDTEKADPKKYIDTIIDKITLNENTNTYNRVKSLWNDTRNTLLRSEMKFEIIQYTAKPVGVGGKNKKSRKHKTLRKRKKTLRKK